MSVVHGGYLHDTKAGWIDPRCPNCLREMKEKADSELTEARAEVRRLRRGVRDRDDLIRAAAEALREEGYMGKERAKWLEEQAARLTNPRTKKMKRD